MNNRKKIYFYNTLMVSALLAFLYWGLSVHLFAAMNINSLMKNSSSRYKVFNWAKPMPEMRVKFDSATRFKINEMRSSTNSLTVFGSVDSVVAIWFGRKTRIRNRVPFKALLQRTVQGWRINQFYLNHIEGDEALLSVLRTNKWKSLRFDLNSHRNSSLEKCSKEVHLVQNADFSQSVIAKIESPYVEVKTSAEGQWQLTQKFELAGDHLKEVSSQCDQRELKSVDGLGDD